MILLWTKNVYNNIDLYIYKYFSSKSVMANKKNIVYSLLVFCVNNFVRIAKLQGIKYSNTPCTKTSIITDDDGEMYFRLEMCVYWIGRQVFESQVVLVAGYAILDHLHVLVYSIYSIVVRVMQSIKTEYINFHSEPFYYHIFPLFFFKLLLLY